MQVEADVSVADLFPITMVPPALLLASDTPDPGDSQRTPCIMLCGNTTSGSQFCRKWYCDGPGDSLLQVYTTVDYDELYGQYDALSNTFYVGGVEKNFDEDCALVHTRVFADNWVVVYDLDGQRDVAFQVPRDWRAGSTAALRDAPAQPVRHNETHLAGDAEGAFPSSSLSL